MKRKLIRLIEVTKIWDDCNLVVAEHLPFEIKRAYWIMDANTDLSRGLHAHKKTDQVLFCIKGTITITLDNGKKREEITLNKPNVGIILYKMIWHEMKGFKKDTILLALSSHPFDPGDYVRNYHEFRKLAKK